MEVRNPHAAVAVPPPRLPMPEPEELEERFVSALVRRTRHTHTGHFCCKVFKTSCLLFRAMKQIVGSLHKEAPTPTPTPKPAVGLS